MKKLLLLTLMLATLIFAGSQAAADTIICPTTDDVYIDSGSPTTNFSDKTRVLVSYHPPVWSARGLWKFNIPEGIHSCRNRPARSCTCQKLYCRRRGSAIDGHAFYALNSAFAESTETWNTHSGGDYDTSVCFTAEPFPHGQPTIIRQPLM